MLHRSPRPRSAACMFFSGAATLAAAALTVLVPAILVPAQASALSSAEPAVHYVALGDSYSSGVGAGSYLGSSGSCDQSARAYPALWDAAGQSGAYEPTFGNAAG